MRTITLKVACIWALALAAVSFARVHFRSMTTQIAYQLGQLKQTEGRLLETQSELRSELAKLTTKKKLESLSGDNDVK